MNIEVNGHRLTATLANNKSAKAFANLLKQGPLSLELHDYGSFEKVGPLGQSLPTSDERLSSEAGDIFLYQGNQLTIFYGENTWSYTPLAKIDNTSADELREILGSGNVTVIFTLG